MGLFSCPASLLINLNLWPIPLKLCIFFWRFVDYFQVTTRICPHILRNHYVTHSFVGYVTVFCLLYRNKLQNQERHRTVARRRLQFTGKIPSYSHFICSARLFKHCHSLEVCPSPIYSVERCPSGPSTLLSVVTSIKPFAVIYNPLTHIYFYINGIGQATERKNISRFFLMQT